MDHKLVIGGNLFKKVIISALLFYSNIFFAQVNTSYTLNGFIYDDITGETMIGANIFVKELEIGTTSNIYGFYSLTLPEGSYEIVVSFIGYENNTKDLNFNKSRKVDFRINRTSYNLEEIVVEENEADHNVKSTDMGTANLVPNAIDKIPVLLGEKDILKTIQLLPGISSAGEGSSGFVVRGGTSDQNLVILDEAPVYNASHLLGFFSVFNSDAIKNAKILKGISGPEYGGRLSSVFDIAMKDGSNRDFSTYGGIGLISSRLTLEGPIVKDKGSFIVSGRRTYADLFFPLADDEQLENSALYFYDLNAKLNYTLGENDRIFISAYTGRDVFNFDNAFGFDWGNTTATFRWNHIISDKLFSNTTLLYSEYNYEMSMEDSDQLTSTTSGIRDLNLKIDLQYYVNSDNTLKFGLNGIYHTFSPGEISSEGNSFINSKKINESHAMESNIYIGHELSINPFLKFNYGLRLSNFTLLGSSDVYTFDENGNVVDTKNYGSGEVIKSYTYLEPRISASYLLDESSSVKFGYARNTQNIHLLSTSTTSTPLDIWQPSTSIVEPEISDQVSLGYFRNFDKNKYNASIEFYYKDMQNLIEYKNGADIFVNEYIESQLVFGEGRSYGLEFLFEKKTGRFTGWLSYTLSKTERQFEELNNGEFFPSRQDRTHDISIIGMYNLNEKWALSANWIYYTGLSATYPAGKYTIDGVTANFYTKRNGQRMPDYHRLDIGATYYIKKENAQEMSLTFSLYNVYGRENAYSISFEDSDTNPNTTEAVKMALFSMVPSITFNFRF